MKHAGLVVTLLGALLVLCATSVMAQETVVLTDSQKALNKEGVQAIIDGDYDKAIRSLHSALALGRANAILLNLGRAYANAGECKKALELYDQVPDAPAVSRPGPEEVAKVLARYRAELDTTSCPAVAILDCPQSASFRVNGGEWVSCADGKVRMLLDAGQYQFEVLGEAGRNVTNADLGAMEEREITLKPPPEDVEPGPGDDPPAAARTDSGWLVPGLWIAGSGLALMGVAFAIDNTVIADDVDKWNSGEYADTPSKKDDIESSQALNLGLFGLGGAAAITGAAFVIYALVSGPADERPAQAGLYPVVSLSDSAGQLGVLLSY